MYSKQSDTFHAHHEDIPGVQAVAAQAPCHVLVRNASLVFPLERHHAGEGDSFHCFNNLPCSVAGFRVRVGVNRVGLSLKR